TLKIAGTGPQEKELKEKVRLLGLKNIIFLGHKSSTQLKKIIYNSKFVMLPSLCYDVFPTSVLETFSAGKPIVASKIGGIPEQVKNRANGLLFQAGNKNDCVRKILELWNDQVLCRSLGMSARICAEKNYGPEVHYKKLMKEFSRIVNLRNFE
ncbi:MAG TPA: glycosyltransferase family 4 protein, partial [Flavobacterium sp.]|uniref:glycosyltransferase family 4 protein n=1 Tax=Flavobacterium sp. TaxID=239 RepID=UPI002ED68E99